MNTKAMLVAVVLLGLLIGTAQAGILNKVKEAAKEIAEEVTKEQPAGAGAASKSEAGGGAAAPGNTEGGGSAITAAASSGGKHPGPSTEKREYYPSLSYSTVLNGVKVHYKQHTFSLNNIQATFIDDNQAGYIILRTAAGKELYRFEFRAQPVEKPYTLLEIMGTFDVRTGEKLSGGAFQVELEGPGDYVLDFYLPTEHFYTFPFTVEVIGSDDPFAGENWWVTSGDWFDWGYLYIPQANPEQNLYWKQWIRRKDKGQTARLEEDVKIKVEIHGPGGLLCVSRDATFSLGPDWNRWEFDMAHPEEGATAAWGEYFKAKDLLAKDGDYTLTVKVNEALYGTWKFTVAGGKFQYKGRTVRAEADPLRFIEGGRDAWWYCREK